MGKKVNVLTQNIDGLHRKAGSSDIIELHGTLQYATCPKCKKKYNLAYINDCVIPRCKKTNAKGNVCNFILKPDVVLFGDEVKGYEEALQKAYDADLFLTLGSSLKVYPVNQIPMMLSRAPGIKKVIINKEATIMDKYFDLTIHDSIGATINTLKTYL
jgi:NAD-dependent deacetylase